MQARGELNLAVTVGPDGNAIKVQDLGGVGGANAREMTQYVQSVFMMAKFKPASVPGNPMHHGVPVQAQAELISRGAAHASRRSRPVFLRS